MKKIIVPISFWWWKGSVTINNIDMKEDLILGDKVIGDIIAM